MTDLAPVSPVLLLLLGLGCGVLISSAYWLIWRLRYTRRIRRSAIQQSHVTIAGLVHEQLLPYLPGFPFNPKDARFLGSPVDLVVFDGLDAGLLERIVFLEVKTGNASLTARERQVRQVVQQRGVLWQEFRVGPQAERSAG
jgi:predicted Holliday junction resolvase-like endonuclease